MKEYGYLRVSGGLLLRCRQSGAMTAAELSPLMYRAEKIITHFPMWGKSLNYKGLVVEKGLKTYLRNHLSMLIYKIEVSIFVRPLPEK